MDNYITFEEYRKFWERFSEVAYAFHDDIMLHGNVYDVIDDLKALEVREDDSWIVTYPKAGTTWTQEIMSCVMHDGNLEEVNKRHTFFRVPFLEMSLPKSVREGTNIPENYQIVEKLPSPRVIKSHLPGHLLPTQLWQKKPKIIYVIRNPKDLVVSYYYFTKVDNLKKQDLSFGEFFDDMLSGKVPYGLWWDHYLYFWKRRHDSNILFLRFEDMKRDLRGNVEKISQFLGKNLSSETLDAITEHCTFANMKKNPMTNPDTLLGALHKSEGVSFMRKGKVGDWKSHFTVAQNEDMDALMRDKLYGTGLTFDH